MSDAVLAVNAGSSSLKFALFELDGEAEPREAFRDQIDGVVEAADLHAVLARVDAHLGADRLLAAGHRVVHGGTRFVAPVLVDPAVLEALEALTPLAPLHQPHNLAPIRALAAARPGLAQVACFDTAFHATMPDESSRLALPRAISDSGVRRYGFHGLSYEYIASRLGVVAPALAGGRVLVAHLGNGASLCAIHAGRSVDTTMGFTALDGLVMGTRPGTLDPGAVLYLMRERKMNAAEVEDMLYHRAGLLGVSGISGDMRTLLASNDPYAREAVTLFVARLAREAGGLVSALGGLDGIVFTGGIGEHAAPIRAEACARLAWLGLRLDAAVNARGAGRISADGSDVEAWVIPTDEELMVVRHTAAVLGRLS
ncbi:MAG: acetate/propionate family kinase [Acetobacteraceae bacterium]